MDNKLFRQKSIDRLSSPEQLQDYMRVTSPGVWFVFAAVIVLLAGFFIASVFGRIESTTDMTVRVENGLAVFEAAGPDADALKEGMVVRVKGMETTIETVHWITSDSVRAAAPVDLPDGTYSAVVVTEVITPIRFLTN